MRFKIQFLLYIGMIGIPILLTLLLISYVIKSPAASLVLTVLLGLLSLIYGLIGIREAFIHGKE